MSERETLIHAAEILEREAQALFECSTFRGVWGDDEQDAKDDHDDMLQIAQALRGMAEKME